MMQWLHTLQIHNFHETATRLKNAESANTTQADSTPPVAVKDTADASEGDTANEGDIAGDQEDTASAKLLSEEVEPSSDKTGLSATAESHDKSDTNTVLTPAESDDVNTAPVDSAVCSPSPIQS